MVGLHMSTFIIVDYGEVVQADAAYSGLLRR